LEYYNDGTNLDFDIVCTDSTGQIPQTGQAGNISVSLYDSALNSDAATITVTEVGTTGYYRIRTTYTDINLGTGDGLWRWKFTHTSPDFTFIPQVATLKLPASTGSDSPGVTTLLSRIGAVITITGGKVDINDKTGFSLSGTQSYNLTGNITGNLSGSVGSVTGSVNSLTTWDKTGYSIGTGGITSTSFAANAIDAAAIASNALTSSEIAASANEAIADAILNRNVGSGSNTGRLVKEALYLLRNKAVISGGTLTVYQTDDSTSQWTAVITTTAGNPISGVDPA
jgi:hypothetical protein